jgi:hypothetical protein
MMRARDRLDADRLIVHVQRTEGRLAGAQGEWASELRKVVGAVQRVNRIFQSLRNTVSLKSRNDVVDRTLLRNAACHQSMQRAACTLACLSSG